ncbi:carcinoembryonic antigen-related cell adhesion molecule 1 isoform X2 [Nematolebias whitei]|uniref:carcinoembryonic antigen-related cell adhesion molecule 1 isoform X2 n=1 Tax=Nematolebias whitei TaxID=451745 RepID=UPI0018982F37|nr:carcinoembryonic antigen-related cell adhesion molecule 1 isoform X2 [Nematolebias whitei]
MKREWGRMTSSTAFLLILTTIISAGLVHSQRIYTPTNPVPVGSNLTIFTDVSVTVGAWLFNNDILVFIFPGGQIINDAHKDRVLYDSSTSSLTIISATLENSGKYKLQQINVFIANLDISIQVPVTNVTLSARKINLIEYNDTAVLVCSVSNGSSLSYTWLDGNSVIVDGGNVQFSNQNTTLTISMVASYNQGPYRCNVSNGIGYEVSAPLLLNISYGPKNTTITVNPVKTIYKTGSNVSLLCSTESSPSAIIHWMFNDTYLNQFGPQLTLESISASNSGNYKCVVYNAVTLRSSSASRVIQTMDPLTTVAVIQTGGPAALHEPFTLICDVPEPADTVLWWKDDQLISADNTTVFDVTNKTLTISSAQLSDNGNYQCQAFNAVSNMTSSPYELQVHYGPDMLTIVGPNVVKTGDNVTLSCHAESVPPSLYRWYFKGSIVSNMSDYITPPLSKDMSGKYICMAFNNIINKNSTDFIMLTVVDPIEKVQIEAQAHDAIEGDSYVLTCIVTGTVDRIYWMKNGEPLQADNRTVFEMDNQTVMFMTVERSDAQHYQCMAINAFGNMTSDSYWLLVIYGPETPTIWGPNAVRRGNNATLSCQAASVPPSIFKWYFNGSMVSNMSEYVTPPLTNEMSWEYICTAFNYITGQNSTASVMLTVIDPIEYIQIEAAMDSSIEGGAHELTCNVIGTVEYINWMINGEPLYADNSTDFSMDNKTVMFNPLAQSHTGDYHCMATNALERMVSSAYSLLVYYGPEMPTIMGPNEVMMGGSVTLSCQAASSPPSQYTWYFNGSLVSNMSTLVTPPLTKGITWKYICMASNYITGKNSNASIIITVNDPIETVQIAAQMKPAIEGDSYELACNVTGTVDYIYWMKTGELLQADNRIIFNMGNKTVRFMYVDRSDTGDYKCMAMNAIENMTSASYSLLVNFGPETPILWGPAYGETGSQVVFNCDAMSVPLSSLSWWFNESMRTNSSVFNTGPLTLNMSGTYTCMAYNHVTGKNSTNSTMLTVIEAIQSVTILNSTMPVNRENFTLTCHIVGPYDTIHWKKDGMYLNMNASSTNSSMYHIEKNSLHFTSLTVENNGNYQCIAINKAALHKSPTYILSVNYGPLNVLISGPASEKPNVPVTLTCSADSQPKCDFQWFLNNKSMPVGNGSIFTFNSQKSNEGNYICEATNQVTTLKLMQTKTFIVAQASATHFITKGSLMFMSLYALSAHLLFL